MWPRSEARLFLLIEARMPSDFAANKHWSLVALCKYDDYSTMDKLIIDKQLTPSRVIVDKCYMHFASADILKVLAKHGAPMRPTRVIELEPLTHYALSYVLMGEQFGYKEKKKFVDVIKYLTGEGHPIEETIEALTTVNTPSNHDVFSLLTPPSSRDVSPALSNSTTTSSVSTKSAASAASSPAAGAADQGKMLISINRKRSSTRASTRSKKARYSP